MEAIAKRFLLLAMVVAVSGCDRLTKDIATSALSGTPMRSYFFDVVRLTYAENPGSFLSLGARLPESVRFGLFTLGAGALLALLIVYGLRSRWGGAKFFGFALFVAGGIANWADRVADGRVVDFLNLGIGPVRTGIFNVADMAISAGVLILILGQYRQWSNEHRHARHCRSRTRT